MARKKSNKENADLDLEGAANQLRPFLAANPYSKIERTEDENKESHIEVVSPWGDKSLALRLDEKSTELADAIEQPSAPGTIIRHLASRRAFARGGGVDCIPAIKGPS